MAAATIDGAEIVLYRDIGRKLRMVPLKNLATLGYTAADIAKFESDSLSIIVEDNIPRPKTGVPVQWKLSNSESSCGVFFVATVEDAERIIQMDAESQSQEKSKERSRRPRHQTAIDLEEKSNDPNPPEGAFLSSRQRRAVTRRKLAKDTAPQEDITTNSNDESTRSKSWPDRVRIKENEMATNREQLEIFERRRIQDRDTPDGKRADDVGVDSRAQSRTRKLRADKSNNDRIRSRSRNQQVNDKPRRIYDARRQLNAIPPQPSKSDPPPPRYWPDMDTFRKLLRTEAELRLRILGSDWEKTVRQESEWRLDLYKDWLWTLHNGVGDSIVPPSRYERARQTRQSTEDKRARQRRPRKELTQRDRRPRGRRTREEMLDTENKPRSQEKRSRDRSSR